MSRRTRKVLHCGLERSSEMRCNQNTRPTLLAEVLFALFLALTAAAAADSHVTLWARRDSSTNELRTAVLTLRTNETACLVSWPQMDSRCSFLTIRSDVNSVMITRKPEVEVDEKTRRVKENGILALPSIVVCGPATLKLAVPAGLAEDTYCTFRIVHGPTRVVKTSD